MELRKRKAAAAPPPPTTKKPAKAAKTAAVPKAKAPVKEKPAQVAKVAAAATNGSPAAAKPAVGDTITLDGFGGEIETNDGTKTTLKALVDASKSGVVLFTYPKASTPGCMHPSHPSPTHLHPHEINILTPPCTGTRQACLFRDAYTALSTASGLAIYGLSTDSPKANTAFKDKQRLPYPLLCDPAATLIAAVGLKKSPKGTTRGVFVVDKEGRVLASQPGGPEGTVGVVLALVEGGLGAAAAEEVKENGDGGEEVKEEVKEVMAANGDGKKSEEEEEDQEEANGEDAE